MNAAKPLTGLALLTNGEHVQFTAPGGDPAQQIVQQLSSGQVFTKPNVIIASARGLIVLNAANIVRLDLDGEGLDDLLLLDGMGAKVQRTEVTADEWNRFVHQAESRRAKRSELIGTPGQMVVGFVRLAMAGGLSVYMRHALRSRMVIEQKQFLKEFSKHKAFPFRNQTGGIALINPANVVAASFYPGGEPPSDSWRVTDFVVQGERNGKGG